MFELVTAWLPRMLLFMVVAADASINCSATCSVSYTTLNDTWRSVSNGFYDGRPWHCDSTGAMAAYPTLSAAPWFRFLGPGGRRMPVEPPGQGACGTSGAGFLATTHAALGAAPTSGTACFDQGAALDVCAVSVAIELCTCSFDQGATLTYFYRLPRPAAHCNFAVCV